jgi:hypothetical protein
MSTPTTEPPLLIAAMVADAIAGIGYAFVEDDKIEELAQTLDSFFATQGIPTNCSQAVEYFQEVEEQIESRGGTVEPT